MEEKRAKRIGLGWGRGEGGHHSPLQGAPCVYLTGCAKMGGEEERFRAGGFNAKDAAAGNREINSMK